MFRAIIMMAVLVAAGIFANEAQAQQRRVVVGVNAGFGNYYYNPYCVNPFWGNGFYGRGSTVYGDHLRGQAAYMQSYGLYLQQRAAAAAAYEEARRRYLENQRLYWEMRRQFEADRAARKAAEREARRQANLERLERRKKD